MDGCTRNNLYVIVVCLPLFLYFSLVVVVVFPFKHVRNMIKINEIFYIFYKKICIKPKILEIFFKPKKMNQTTTEKKPLEKP